jgi:murein DD-endopeptidase MepM/ murein hydrolase activator NlpD
MTNPLQKMRIRTHQSDRYNPISNTFGMVRNSGAKAHQGWDLEAEPGTSVFAVAAGTLTKFTSNSYGLCLELAFTLGDKKYYAFYAHLGSIMLSSLEMTVREGACIATTGTSGNAKGLPKEEAHLHFEIRTAPNAKFAGPLSNRIDPGELLGYQYYTCRPGDPYENRKR